MLNRDGNGLKDNFFVLINLFLSYLLAGFWRSGLYTSLGIGLQSARVLYGSLFFHFCILSRLHYIEQSVNIIIIDGVAKLNDHEEMERRNRWKERTLDKPKRNFDW